MDNKFTEKLQQWLETPKEQRNLEEGALLLLQLTNNKILYNNISRNLRKHADFIEFKLKRYLSFRLQSLTHTQVLDMQAKVERIASEHALDKTPAAPSTKGQEWRKGKRADHDALPTEIQALYVENASLLQKMRELHLQLRNLSTANSTCPDSDRYPFLKELIELDKRYHRNWQAYDTYATSSAEGKTSADSASAEQSMVETARLEQKNVARQINLAKGRYKKAPSEKLKEQLAALYRQLASPSEKLTEELRALGVIAEQ